MKRIEGASTRQSGFSLMELMVSITIGMVVLAAILSIFSATSSTGKQSETATRMSEDAAVAMNYMSSSIRMAGYSLPRVNAAQNAVTFGTGTIVVNDSNFSGTPLRGCDLGFSVATAAFPPACNSSGTATAAISVRFEGDVYNTTPVGGNASDCLGQAVAATTSSDYSEGGPTVTYALVESRFFVRQSSSGTPELACGGNGGASNYVAQPVMQYVESLSLTYGVAKDLSSNVVSRYLTQTALDADGTANVLSIDQSWRRVVSVKICLVMRSEVPDQNGAGSYVNCLGQTVASTDKFARRAFRSVVTLRNRGSVASNPL